MSGPLTDDEVTVWRWSLDQPPVAVESLSGSLSHDEIERADAFAGETARRRFVVARAGLRRLLASLTGRPANGLRFSYGPMGKPRLAGANGPAPCFNLAHSGDLALCAVGAEPVGVDVERVRPLADPAGMAERWYSPAERRRIESAPQSDRLHEFFRVWTAKEAALKLLGLGVGESLPRIETPEERTGGLATSLMTNEFGATDCWVQPIEMNGDHFAALATLQRPGVVTLSDLSL